MTPPFGLFKRKTDESNTKNMEKEERKISQLKFHKEKDKDTLTLSDALSIIHNIRSEKESKLLQKLSPIKDSVEKSMRSISNLADSLEQQEVKLEEDRFKSIVENSKKNVLFSLRREVSSTLPSLKSVQDAQKFQERLISIVDRFGEVSGSHSKVFNLFIKKYAGKLKDEFETLSSLLKKTKSLINEFENEIEPVKNCEGKLNKVTELSESIKSTQLTIENITGPESQILKNSITELMSELTSLENSMEFEKAADNMKQIDLLKQEEENMHKEVVDLFSHLSRAITKYSYGMSKETLSRLRVLSNEPWKLFSEQQDIKPYTTLLVEIQKSISTSKISLKDSDKAIHYIEIILKKIPEFERKVNSRRQRLNAIMSEVNEYKYRKEDPVARSNDLKKKISSCHQEIDKNKELVNKLTAQLSDEKDELESLKEQSQEILSDLAGKSYFLNVDVPNV